VTVRKRTRFVTALAVVGVTVVAWVSLHAILSHGFARLETTQTQRAVQHATAALNAELGTLSRTACDWAARDGISELLQARSPSSLNATPSRRALLGLGADLVLFVNPEGKIVHAVATEGGRAARVGRSPELARYVSRGSALLRRCLRGRGACGVVMLSDQVMLAAAHPIAARGDTGGPRGMLVLGRFLSPQDFTAISQHAFTQFVVQRADDPGLPRDFRVALQALSRSSQVLVRPQSAAIVSGYAVIRDLRDSPALLVRSDVRREIAQQGNAIVLSCVLALLIAGVLLGIAVSVLLDRAVISRLSDLSAQVRRIAESGEASARVSAPGSDELAGLAEDINGMLRALEQSRDAVRENEGQLRTILDSVHTGFLIIDADTHGIVDANPAALGIMGCRRDEVIGTTCERRVCPAEPGRCPITDLNQELDNAEQVVLAADGGRVPVLKTAALVTLGGRRYILESFVDITERKHAEEAIRYQAYHDGLTELPNRTRFYEHLHDCLAQARRASDMAAVLFLDLDRFKTINDTLGHAVGDALLKEVAARLADTLRGRDSIARLGGDEFAVLLTAMESAEGAAAVARRMLASLRAPFYVNGYELHTTASIGVSLFPRDGEDAESLLQSADIALYHAKDQGRNTFRYYDSWINASTRERLELENDLRHALEREQLVLHYQPQIHVPTGRIVGMEALLRWQHPELGLILPGRFISIAEETGLIEPIGEWVLKRTCAQNKEWQREDLPAVQIAVNLSPVQFHQQDLIAVVRRALGESGLDPRYLQLELTESTAMRNVDFSIRLMARLKEMGVGLCLDDFGVGYTSLVYLKQFPLDTVKIDRMFLNGASPSPGSAAWRGADSSEAAIISAIIGIARSLGLGVIGEGVETSGQLRLLLERDCEVMQGYLFSKPVPAGTAAALLREQRLQHTAVSAV
jgi:diguanylate cyclase (GGDEF)-like protein/PAS domain S-box-containing protein